MQSAKKPMRLTRRSLLLLMLISASGCAITPTVVDPAIVEDPCTALGFKKIHWTPEDAEVMSRKLAEDIKAHNDKVEENC